MVRVYARGDDGVETEITEGVQVLYDMVIGSMDWGSGFFTVEDALPVVHVAKACGFKDWQRAQDYVDDMTHSAEQTQFLAKRRTPEQSLRSIISGIGHGWGGGLLGGTAAEEHEHVFSSVGRCMWPGCRERRP